MKIVVLEKLALSEDELRAIAKPITSQGHEMVVYDRDDNVELQKERVKDAEILVIGNMPLKGEVIRAADKLKYLPIAFTGFDHVDLDACKEKGIKVSNASGYANVNVAELTIGMMLVLLRNVISLNTSVRQGGKAVMGQDLCGKTVGVVGAGAIGRKVVELLIAFGCKVIVYDVFENDAIKKMGAVYKPLEDVMKESDIVTIHTPLMPETRGLISEKMLGLMKPTAFLINCARGPIVDLAALAKALQDGKIAGAGVDVFDMEPPIPTDYHMMKTPNSVLTPHIAFLTKEAMIRRAEITFNDNIASWLKGELKNKVLG